MGRKLLLTVALPAGLVLGTTALSTARPAPVGTGEFAHGQPPAQAPGVRLRVAPTGNEVRYRIRELLAGMELPYDAVGKAGEVTGSILIGTDGKVVPNESKVVARVTGLTSDKERRDGFVQRRLLETEKFPTVELAPTGVRGLSGRLPTSGARNFELLGNLTVRGVTRPTVWRVAARFQGDRVTGTASTRFTFADFELTQPRVPVVLSLADTIQLEYDFNLKRETVRR